MEPPTASTSSASATTTCPNERGGRRSSRYEGPAASWRGPQSPRQGEAQSQATPRNGLTEMVTTREMGPAIILLAAVVAMGLGALHALEPGHGKTVVAAYLVGSRGTAWHAMVLGLTVTLSHTAGVYFLGGLTLYASRYVVPERLFPS